MWYYNYYIAALILSLIYFIISRQKLSILISIIIIIILSYLYISKINDFDNDNKTNLKNQISELNKDIQYREHLTDSNNYYLKKFPNEIKYLIKDKTLFEIVLNIRYTKRYDLEKYTNILFHIDKLYKIYMFILSGRYDINKYFDIFVDLRNMIIREMYEIYVILPLEMKYYYGFNSFDELKKSIEHFIKYSRNMIKILERYGYQEKGVYYLKDVKYKPYENNNINNVF
jgi:hypothetical protein